MEYLSVLWLIWNVYQCCGCDMEYLSVLCFIWKVYQCCRRYGILISVVSVTEYLSVLWLIWNVYQLVVADMECLSMLWLIWNGCTSMLMAVIPIRPSSSCH